MADVRFTPESGQIADISGCPLCAKSVLTRRNKKRRYSIISSTRPNARDFAERDLWNMGGPLDRFDPREFNYLGPFLGVFGD